MKITNVRKTRRIRRRRQIRHIQRGGVLGVRLKYLAALLNPANADRMICKNEFFVEFLDMSTVKPHYPYVQSIKQVLDGERVFFFSEKNVPERFRINTNVDAAKAITEAELKDDKTPSNTPVDLPVDPPTSQQDDNPEHEDNPGGAAPAADAVKNNVETKLNEETDKNNQAMNRVLLKGKSASTLNKNILPIVTLLSGGLINNLESSDVYARRLTFADINDAPLVDKGTWDNRNIGVKKKWLKFKDEFTFLFRILHYFKYQFNRTLWVPAEMLKQHHMYFLFDSLFTAVNNNPILRRAYKEKAFTNLAFSDSRRKALQLNSLYAAKCGLVNEQSMNEQTPLSPTEKTKEENEIKNEESNNGGQKGGATFVLSWQMVAKLKKQYDFDSPLGWRPPNPKYWILDKKFPKYMESEVKFAMLTLYCFLKDAVYHTDVKDENKLSIVEKTGTFTGGNKRYIDITKLRTALRDKIGAGEISRFAIGSVATKNGTLDKMILNIDQTLADEMNDKIGNQSNIDKQNRDEYYKGFVDLVNVVPEIMIRSLTALMDSKEMTKEEKKIRLANIRQIFREYKNKYAISREYCTQTEKCTPNRASLLSVRDAIYGTSLVKKDPLTRQNIDNVDANIEKRKNDIKFGIENIKKNLIAAYNKSAKLVQTSPIVDLNDYVEYSEFDITNLFNKYTPVVVKQFKFRYGENGYGNNLDDINCDWFKKITYRQLITLIEYAASDAIPVHTTQAKGGRIRHTVRQESKTRRRIIHHQPRKLTNIFEPSYPLAIPRKHIRETRNKRVHMRGGTTNMGGIGKAMDIIFQQCNCWMVKRMANEMEVKAKDPEMIEPINRFLIMMGSCVFNGFNVLSFTLGIFLANELIPGLPEARLSATLTLSLVPLIRSAVEAILTVPTVQLLSNTIRCSKLTYLTQNRLSGTNTNDKSMLDLEISLIASPFIPFVNYKEEIKPSLELSLKDIHKKYAKFEGFVPGWYYVYDPPFRIRHKAKEYVPVNIAYVESISFEGNTYKLNLCYFVAVQLDKYNKLLSPNTESIVTNGNKPSDSLFKDEYFNETCILQPMSYVEPPNICDGSVDLIKLTKEDKTPANKFIWINSMFLGYAKTEQLASMKGIGVKEYSFDMLCTEVKCPTEGVNNMWFLKRFTLEEKKDVMNMLKEGKSSQYYFTTKDVQLEKLRSIGETDIFANKNADQKIVKEPAAVAPPTTAIQNPLAPPAPLLRQNPLTTSPQAASTPPVAPTAATQPVAPAAPTPPVAPAAPTPPVAPAQTPTGQTQAVASTASTPPVAPAASAPPVPPAASAAPPNPLTATQSEPQSEKKSMFSWWNKTPK